MEHRILQGPTRSSSLGLCIICYVDDTLVTARGTKLHEATRLATRGASLVVGRNEALGLRVALDKKGRTDVF